MKFLESKIPQEASQDSPSQDSPSQDSPSQDTPELQPNIEEID